MIGPDWLNDFFAAVMVAIAVYGAGRLAAARWWNRPTHVDVDIAHVLMGAAMAGMLVRDLDPVPSGIWEVVFALVAAWFIWHCYKFVREHGVEGRDEDHVHHLSHYVTHLVMAGAMLYMYMAAVPAVVARGGSMAMGAATGTTTDFLLVPFAFIVVLFASAIWELDGIERFMPGPSLARLPEPALVSGGAHPTAADGVPVTTSRSERADQSRQNDRWLAPRLEAGCHIAMCITMGYMLILML